MKPIKSLLAVVLFWKLVRGTDVNPLNGAHLKLPMFHSPPRSIITVEANGSTSYTGLAVDAIDWLEEQCNFTYEFVVWNQSELKNSNLAVKTIGALLAGEIDILATFISPNVERLRIMDFSSPFLIAPYRFVVPWPDEESRLLAPIKPFQWPVWLLLLISILLVTVILSLLTRYHKRSQSLDFDLSFWQFAFENWNYLLTVITNQGNFFPSSRLSLRLVAGTWCLVCVVLVNAYAGNLTSFLTTPKLNPIIQSFEDMAKSTQLRVSVEKGTLIHGIIMRATSGPLKVLGDTLRNDPKAGYVNQPEAVANLKSGKYALLLTETEAKYYASIGIEKKSKCRFVASPPLPYFQSYGFGLPKNGPYNQIISKKLTYLFETGIFGKWEEKYLPDGYEQCMQLGNQKPDLKPLKLTETSSAFLIVGIGLLISLVAFSFELFVRCHA